MYVPDGLKGHRAPSGRLDVIARCCGAGSSCFVRAATRRHRAARSRLFWRRLIGDLLVGGFFYAVRSSGPSRPLRPFERTCAGLLADGSCLHGRLRGGIEPRASVCLGCGFNLIFWMKVSFNVVRPSGPSRPFGPFGKGVELIRRGRRPRRPARFNWHCYRDCIAECSGAS